MRSLLSRKAARARRMFSSSTSAVSLSCAQGIQGFSSSSHSETAAYTSVPSPGMGERIRSLSVSKLSGKSLKMGGLTSGSLPCAVGDQV
jgi:hypothetical protein